MAATYSIRNNWALALQLNLIPALPLCLEASRLSCMCNHSHLSAPRPAAFTTTSAFYVTSQPVTSQPVTSQVTYPLRHCCYFPAANCAFYSSL